MARGSQQANDAATNAVGQNKGYYGGGQSLYNTLAPQLTAQAANPQGFGKETLARLDTATQQSAGGGAAAATGQAALEDSRTRNAGGSGMALSKAIRESGKNATDATLQTRLANEQLKDKQRSTAQSGLEGLYGVNVGGGNQALGQVASNVQANAAQEDASWGWAKNVLAPVLGAAGQAAGGAKYCWIAEAVYGIDDPRTFMVRAWLTGPFMATRFGSVVMGLYRRFGQRIAAIARRSRMLRAALKPLFDIALRKAIA